MCGGRLELKPEDFIYKPDTYGTIRAIGIDKYPGEMPIVRELIQNADDASAGLVRIIVNEKEIVAENDGRPFTKLDYSRISHIGMGKTEEEMTGTFGIGFTSVFHITDHPRIVSNGIDFEINVDDLPKIKLAQPAKTTSIHLQMRTQETELSKNIHAEVFGSTKKVRFEAQLPSEIYHDIFFLKNVKRIEYQKNGEKRLFVSKKIRRTETIAENIRCEYMFIQISTFITGREKKTVEKWLKYTLENIEIPASLQRLGQTKKQKVSIAVPYCKKRFPKRLQDFFAYFTLPVKPTGFKFHYNASKLFTTSGRRDFLIKEGLRREWNMWQMDNLANLLAAVLTDLCSKGVHPLVLYEFVPTSYQASDEMDKHIFNSFKEKVEAKKVKLFFTSEGLWKEKENVYVNWNGLAKLMTGQHERSFIHPKLHRFHLLFSCYEIPTFDLDDFVEHLESKYGTETYENEKTEEPVHLRKIYEYLGKRRLDQNLIERLKEICFLLNEKKTLCSYGYRIHFPTEKNMPLINPDDILHHSTYNSKLARKFLEKKLKITKTSLHSLVVDTFIPRIEQYDPEQKLEFVWYLAKRKKEIIRDKEVMEQLKNNVSKLVLLKETYNPEEPIFFRQKELVEIFGSRLNHLSKRYEQQGRRGRVKWKDFFGKIGIKTYPSAEEFERVVFADIDPAGYTPENLQKAKLIMSFLDRNWRRFYSKHKDQLKALRNYEWVPTTKKVLTFPTDVYTNLKISKLVGKEMHFLAMKSPKNKGLIRLLRMAEEARLKDVVKFILQSQGREEGRDKSVPFRIYSFLDKKARFLDDELRKTLINNRTVWFKGKLWSPKKLLIQNLRNEFGPNGWLRGYLQGSKLVKLTQLCKALDIHEDARIPYDYVEWLLDVPLCASHDVKGWTKKLIQNAYLRISPLINTISEDDRERLASNKVILSSEGKLLLPDDCYIARKSDDVLLERLSRAGISVPMVEAQTAELEKLFGWLGVREIVFHLSCERSDNSQCQIDEVFAERIRQILPWIKGYEVNVLGKTCDHELDFTQLEVYRVNELKLKYCLDEIMGEPIEDFCCLQKNGKWNLFLDSRFDLENNEHLQLLSLQIIRKLSQEIDRIQWCTVIPMLLVLRKIIGFSPYVPQLEELSFPEKIHWKPMKREMTLKPPEQPAKASEPKAQVPPTLPLSSQIPPGVATEKEETKPRPSTEPQTKPTFPASTTGPSKITEEWGMERAMDFERTQGRKPYDVSKHRPSKGYDIESTDPTTKEKRCIEVKTTVVQLTNNEQNVAQRLRDSYFLYVVHKLHGNTVIQEICNPTRTCRLMEVKPRPPPSQWAVVDWAEKGNIWIMKT